MEPQQAIKDHELNYLSEYLHETRSIHNNLLTFSFTAVLAVLGIAFSNINSENLIPSFLYLLPFCLIIPFTARITYYRISGARIESFLDIFYPESRIFSRGCLFVKEKQNYKFNIISFLVNFEMFILSYVCTILFINDLLSNQSSEMFFPLQICCSIVCLILEIIIILQGYNYEKIYLHFRNKWKLYSILFGPDFKNIISIEDIYSLFYNQLNTNPQSNYKADFFGYTDNQLKQLLNVLEEERLITYTFSSKQNYTITLLPKFKRLISRKLLKKKIIIIIKSKLLLPLKK